VSNLYVGLMSGTSLDGVDGALVRSAGSGWPQILGAVHLDFPPALRALVLQVCQHQGARFTELGRIDIEVARLYASAVQQLLAQTGVAASAVRAIGAHGQTVHHAPLGDTPFTLQLGDPNTLAVLTGINVVADFRRRDMALGGQGAPLAPGFHDAVLRHPTRARVVLNCGGIANISVLLPGQPCVGFDTGPANILMDAWMQKQRALAFDRDGVFALVGQVHTALLEAMLADPYFALPAPKSTGREHFNLAWVERHVAALGGATPTADVQRTLLELTAQTITDAVLRYASTGDLLVAGGGAHNSALMGRLRALNTAWSVESTARHGIPPEQMEAVAFAVFAQRTVDGLTGNLPSVTGASRPCVLGAIYTP
jgi:anhydro-N-acetylmuramic acid kinase